MNRGFDDSLGSKGTTIPLADLGFLQPLLPRQNDLIGGK